MATNQQTNGRSESVVQPTIIKSRTPIFKVIVAGEGGVGKTSIIRRYLFEDSSTPVMTVGSEFAYQDIEINSQRVGLSIWDFGGEERFRELMPIFCLGAHGAIVVFDLTRFSTFLQLEFWMDVIHNSTNGIPIILVGAKADLEGGPSEDEIRTFCQTNGIRAYMPVSARSGTNITQLFEFLTEKMLQATDEGFLKPAYSLKA
ncbi:GTP-binding protein [Candidatus Bathyarchaeota archaeon]|nr:GTP-binding protein [Candidatus Bathyarchaeota archaeon]